MREVSVAKGADSTGDRRVKRPDVSFRRTSKASVDATTERTHVTLPISQREPGVSRRRRYGF